MSTVLPDYPFDPTGLAASNLIVETQAIESRGTFDHYFVIPRVAPFFAESVKLRLYPIGANVNNPAGGMPLEEGVHYNFGYHFAHASHTIGKPIYGSINFYDRTLSGQLRMEYQTIGEDWVLDEVAYNELLLNRLFNPRITTWEHVVELPRMFPVVDHDFNIDDFVGMSEVTDELNDIEQAILQSNEGGLQDHIEDISNPHQVSKAQVGLGLVDNFPTAAPAEAQAGILNNRFMTPLRTKQAIDALILPQLQAHMADTNNPHQVTKAQVGLGSVQNLALASQAEAEAGSSNARYSTPLRVREAIEAIVGVTLNAHLADFANPHHVTALQVGLGNVVNIGIATDAAALQGADDSGVITPRLLNYVLSETVGSGQMDHINDNNNPHGVTKTQVGLGSVDNFPTASEAEARDATANNRFMTPLAVRQAINELVGDSSNAHVTDYDNPHQVTAAQTGAYSIDETDDLLLTKLNASAAAVDALAVYGLDQDGLQAWIETLTVANSLNLEGKSLAQITTEILAGKAADSGMLDGKTFAEVRDQIIAVIAGGSAFQTSYDVPAVEYLDDGASNAVPAPVHWTSLGKTAASPSVYGDITLLITGGRDDTQPGEGSHTALLEMAVSKDVLDDLNPENLTMVVQAARLKYLTKGAYPIEIGYVINNQNTPTVNIEIFLKTEGQRTGWATTEFTNKKFVNSSYDTYVTVADLTTVEPAGITYLTKVSDLSEEVGQAMDHIANTSNPHSVTKSQVGLGSVSNYPDASTAEAIAGTASNRFMTPATTSDAVGNAIENLCEELTLVIDNALTNYF